jgi:hypothetical protein
MRHCGREERIKRGWDEDETYIGGLRSPNVFRRTEWGYTIYVTNKRMVGVEKCSRTLTAAIDRRAFGAAWADIVEAETETEEPEEMLMAIGGEDIDIQIFKENVLRVEMKKPTSVLTDGHLKVLANGYLRIETQVGEEIQMEMRHRHEFEILRRLMEIWKPDVLEIR